MANENSKNIYKAISCIMDDIEAIGKNNKNQQQNFNYRSIDQMYNELQPKFAKHRVFITSEVLESSREERQSAKGGLLLWTIIKVKFSFYAEDGSNVSSIMIGEAMDSGDKGSNKAMSIALKYCLMQLFLIPTEDLKKNDNDGHTSEPLYEKPGAKQLVKEGQFAAIMERLHKGEVDVYQKALDKYSFNSDQIKILNETYNQINSSENLKPA